MREPVPLARPARGHPVGRPPAGPIRPGGGRDTPPGPTASDGRHVGGDATAGSGRIPAGHCEQAS
ncbi:hypothetical protein ACIGZJ_19855 [Kitasatospora sp. NPDC052868]|uniref:hypothetical protein n=1 Tax=Kitasatospora sp. NPDC052868 TaxID=3364060 RepID=UPI0037C77F64